MIREAEIVVIYGNPESSGSDQSDWLSTSNLEPNYLNSCPMESCYPHIADLTAIYAMVFERRDGTPSNVRTFDAYIPLIYEFKAQVMYEEWKASWANYNKAIHWAAEPLNIPVAEVAMAWDVVAGIYCKRTRIHL
ncbi:MAG: hypothetical protein ACLFWD_12830 [Anaerolineales bacterium]